MPAIIKAKERNLKLWCNEFGVYQSVSDKIRAHWYQDFLSILKDHNIAWSNWDYKGGFGLYDKNDKPTVALSSLFTTQE